MLILTAAYSTTRVEWVFAKEKGAVFGKPIGNTLHAMSKPEFHGDHQHPVMSLERRNSAQSRRLKLLYDLPRLNGG